MIAPVYRETFKALIPNQGIYYYGMLLLLFVMLFMGAQDSTAVPRVVFALLPMMYFALITGSMLTDMLVKPVSFCLPGQQRTLRTVLVVYGLLYYLLCSLVYLFPNSDLNGSVAVYASLMFLGVAFFLIICIVLLLTTSTTIIGILAFSTLVLAAGNLPDFAAEFGRGFAYVIERPLLCFVMLVVCFIASGACMSKQRKRDLCGRHFLSFANGADQVKASAIKLKIRREKLQKSGSVQTQSMDQTRVPRRALQYPNRGLWLVLNEFCLDSQRVEWKKVFGALLFFAVFQIFSPGGNTSVNNFMLMLPLMIVLPGFVELFKRNLSPMLPTGRRRLFMLSVLKGAFLYLVAIMVLVVWLLMLKIIAQFTKEIIFQFDTIPVRHILFFALLAPLFAWILITLRWVSSIALCILVLAAGMLYVAATYLDNFLEWSFSAIVLLTALLYLPFVYKSYIDCFKRDLVVRNRP